MYKLVIMVERISYNERPNVYNVDRLLGVFFVTVNFGIDQSDEGYSCYSLSIGKGSAEPTAESIIDRITEIGLISELRVSELMELMERTGCDDKLSLVKRWATQRIRSYDSSEAVNQFSINGSPMWLEKATRAGLKLRLEAEQASGKENTTLWYGTEAITLPVANAIVMLNRLEIYASESYDVTQGHLARVALMESVEEVLGYDYKVGYPEKLMF